ncbi:MAG: MFS transporter, partial [Pseudomonadota bacterium]
TSYYIGGLVGAFALGQVYANGGWAAVATLVALALAGALALTGALRNPGPVVTPRRAAGV